jgi:hypothetical protein
MRRDREGISGGRFRLREKGDPMEHPGRPGWGRDEAVSSVQTTCARDQRKEAVCSGDIERH